MKRALFWVQAPRDVISAALPKLTWQRNGEASAARDVAALMVYIALLFEREEVERGTDAGGGTWHQAKATYDELAALTGLSRSLIRQGLERLRELALVTPQGSDQQRSYAMAWSANGWFKLPCRAIVRGGQIVPFTHFRLRSKHELHALKLYLYLASVIGRGLTYAEASYEKIYERTGIPERDIRRAIATLINAGLVSNVVRAEGQQNPSWGPNKYYLTGYADLHRTATPAAAEPATA